MLLLMRIYRVPVVFVSLPPFTLYGLNVGLLHIFLNGSKLALSLAWDRVREGDVRASTGVISSLMFPRKSPKIFEGMIAAPYDPHDVYAEYKELDVARERTSIETMVNSFYQQCLDDPTMDITLFFFHKMVEYASYFFHRYRLRLYQLQNRAKMSSDRASGSRTQIAAQRKQLEEECFSDVNQFKRMITWLQSKVRDGYQHRIIEPEKYVLPPDRVFPSNGIYNHHNVCYILTTLRMIYNCIEEVRIFFHNFQSSQPRTYVNVQSSSSSSTTTSSSILGGTSEDEEKKKHSDRYRRLNSLDVLTLSIMGRIFGSLCESDVDNDDKKKLSFDMLKFRYLINAVSTAMDPNNPSSDAIYHSAELDAFVPTLIKEKFDLVINDKTGVAEDVLLRCIGLIDKYTASQGI